MATHFLLQAKARTIRLRDVFAMGEDKAWDLFKQLRWPENDGKPVCPKCGSVESYEITTRRKHKCKACHHQFSVTSGTIFASRKLSFVDMLGAIVIIANGAKGVSALQLARDLDVQHKTAFVLAHKLREAMASEIAGQQVGGDGETVEVDGCYVGGYIRPANEKKDRIDRRLVQNQTGKRRVVVVARERKGRTVTTVTKTEADGVAFVRAVVADGSEVHADEASHWDNLHAKYLTWRINHQEAYSKGGACTNQAESFLSRLRKMVEGQHHHVSPQHLHAYASHAAWMEDHRREDNGTIVDRVTGLALAHPVSRNWKGYWQRAATGSGTR
ncbi:MAG: IS1595 family transposase [Hyphomicrobiaceae bacterium]|nr:IS1595 family transposase [Hyphomicrobiaceae bacterium]